MKKILLLLLFLIPTISFSQLLINQQVVEQPPYVVGDTITVNYFVENRTNSDGFQYLWFRYDYSNKHIELVPNSTQFLQGQTQNFFHQWVGYIFNSNPTIGVGELDRQYSNSGWNYQLNNDWNVVQLSIQKPGSPIGGIVISQKFRIKDNTNYTNIHRLHLARALDNQNRSIIPIGSQVLWLSLQEVQGLSSSVTLKVKHPANYPIWEHRANIYNSNNSLVESKMIDSSGEVLLTNLITDQDYRVEILPISNSSILDEIVTVSDAYRAFLEIADKGLSGQSSYFTYPIEYKVGNIKRSQDSFNSLDSYYLFSHIVGLDVTADANIPALNNQTPFFHSGKLSSYVSAELDSIISITDRNHIFEFGYAWGGDLDFSHSTSPGDLKSASSRIQRDYREVNVKLQSTLTGRKVIVDLELEEELSGFQAILQYDNSRLKLEDIKFDAGNEVTNFITDKNSRVSFGSIDQLGTGRIKKGKTYSLEFSSSTTLTSTTGLFYIVLTDAVAGKGEKIKINIR